MTDATIDAAAETADPAPSRLRRWRRPLLLAVPLLVAAVLLALWLTSGRYVETDNAYVQHDKVSVAAEINGTIASVAVTENQRVRKGDLLFTIDPRPYRIALADADAQIAQARVQVGQLETQTQGTSAGIADAESGLRYAQANYDRYDALMKRGFATRAAYDEALRDLQEARAGLATARAAQATAEAALRTGGAPSQPAIEAAEVARQRALLNLQRTEVRAPADGFVSQTNRLQVGNAVATGAPMVVIVRSNDTWVQANYKETDLAEMDLGEPATVELDAYPGLELRGHVASIGAGTGSEFSVLPAQNATGNWVKVTQRVPVRIAIDEASPRPLLAGLSATVTVDTKPETTATAGR